MTNRKDSWLVIFLTGLLLMDATVCRVYDTMLYNDLIVRGSSRSKRSLESNSITKVNPDDGLIAQGNVDLPWERFIIAGPPTVCLLAQLMIVSSKIDFSFRDYQSDYQFIYMKYPDSFRATLTQIANDGWNAFMNAHINMNRIQASMALVPRHVRTALYVLGSPKSTTRIISRLMPSTLYEIERLGKTCVQWANATHEAFVTVMSLLGEVISLTETTRGLHETKLRKTEQELNASHIMHTELVKVGQTIKSHYDEAQQAVRTAQSEYSKALRKIPTGFKALLLDLGRAVISIAKAAANIGMAVVTGGMSTVATGIAGAIKTGVSVAKNVIGGIGQQAVSFVTSQGLTFGKLFSSSFSKGLPGLKQILSGGLAGLSKFKNPIEQIDAYKVTFETFLKSIPGGGSSDAKLQAANLIERGVKFFDKVGMKVKQSVQKNEEIEKTEADDMMKEGENIAEESKPMEAAEELGAGTVPPAAAAPPSSSSGETGANERFAAQLALSRLGQVEARYDQIFNRLVDNQREVAELMGKIARLDMERIHYRELLELLREALHLLGEVREQWGQLVLFFAEIATRAEITLGGTLKPFLTQAEQASDLTFSSDERMFYLDLLKSQANDIDSQSQMLRLMASTYVEMSSNFIMGKLAGLSKMLTINSDTERSRLAVEMNLESNRTQLAVTQIVLRRKADFHESLGQRRSDLQNFLNSLGGINQNDQLAIEQGQRLLNDTIPTS